MAWLTGAQPDIAKNKRDRPIGVATQLVHRSPLCCCQLLRLGLSEALRCRRFELPTRHDPAAGASQCKFGSRQNSSVARENSFLVELRSLGMIGVSSIGARGSSTSPTGDTFMRIAQVAPLTEAIPPKLYGGTERVVHWLTEELVALGHDVTLFASGNSQHLARSSKPFWPRALRLDGSVRDPNALHMAMLEHVRRQAPTISTSCTSISTTIRSRCSRARRRHSLPRCMAGSICPSISRCSTRSRPCRWFRFRMRSGGRCRRRAGSARSITGCPRSC